ncbi:hypothetical protein RchiOBHm_Chr2g0089701 [Rosa chinensis]|uniref:Uncharacterized protein n=1 Tax=Rosa chinensis TaxID=74649 RepID=A0A2P6RJ85_ROSCH|nr:hypothetical protein RchiOBHm_Chr2g0089701 [Rosa chinensis]
MEQGKPCIRYISLVKASAMIGALYGCVRATKCPYLDSRSTTTMIAFLPSERGRP